MIEEKDALVQRNGWVANICDFEVGKLKDEAVRILETHL